MGDVGDAAVGRRVARRVLECLAQRRELGRAALRGGQQGRAARLCYRHRGDALVDGELAQLREAAVVDAGETIAGETKAASARTVSEHSSVGFEIALNGGWVRTRKLYCCTCTLVQL